MDFSSQIMELDLFDIGFFNCFVKDFILRVLIAMIFGPVLAYIPQMMMIKKNQSVGNFSIWVCAILIFGNILRIVFWFERNFFLQIFFFI